MKMRMRKGETPSSSGIKSCLSYARINCLVVAALSALRRLRFGDRFHTAFLRNGSDASDGRRAADRSPTSALDPLSLAAYVAHYHIHPIWMCLHGAVASWCITHIAHEMALWDWGEIFFLLFMSSIKVVDLHDLNLYKRGCQNGYLQSFFLVFPSF